MELRYCHFLQHLADDKSLKLAVLQKYLNNFSCGKGVHQKARYCCAVQRSATVRAPVTAQMIKPTVATNTRRQTLMFRPASSKTTRRTAIPEQITMDHHLATLLIQEKAVLQLSPESTVYEIKVIYVP